jgi:serine/threonine protein kinase
MPVPVLYSHDKDSLDEMDSGLPPPPPTKGTILDSHLQLTSVLGEGGFSTVFLARSLIPSAPSPPPRRSSSPARKGTKTLPRSPLATGSGNSLVAVKLLLTPPAHLAHVSPSHAAHTSPTQKSLHLREISLHSLVLPHPSIVPLHKILFHNTYIALVMPYFPRGDLFTAILNDSLFLGRPSAVKDVYLQILDAVGHCHSRGVYMRDLKPENILVDYDPAQKTGPIKIFLTDFGLATSDVESTEFRTGSMYHMSPGMLSHSITYRPMSHLRPQ